MKTMNEEKNDADTDDQKLLFLDCLFYTPELNKIMC